MNILVCGMPRSGSSLLWGLIYICLKLKFNKDDVTMDLVFNYDNLPINNKHNILKIHECNNDSYKDSMKFSELRKWADLVIITKRDIRTCYNSLIKKKLKSNKNSFKYFDDKSKQIKNIKFNENTKEICNFITYNCFKKWKDKTKIDYEFIYENYINNQDQEITNLKNLFDIKNISNEEIIKNFNNLKNKWINNTNHITSSNYKNYSELKNETINILEKNFNDFCYLK